MRKKVCFHVGLPKTGTTTIQKYLRGQEDKLRSLGYLYPGSREHEALGSSKHLLMLYAMNGKVKVPSEGLDAVACREAVASALTKFWQSDLETLIWSCEGMALAAGNWDAGYLAEILQGVDVRVVLSVRYVDDWLESLLKEKIWARAGRRAEVLSAKPLRPIASSPRPAQGAGPRPPQSMLRTAAKIVDASRIMGRALPSAEIVIRSFDADRERGRVVSGALEAMGAPVESAFPDADNEAGVRNPTKTDLYSMLLYHLVTVQPGPEVIRGIAAAARKRHYEGVSYPPLAGRRFRFLSDEDVVEARGYYEALRQDYPDLPAQPPYVSKPAERRLSRDDGVALLDWLRPEISETVFDKACAAYPANPES